MAGNQDEYKSIPPRETTTKGDSNQGGGNASDEVRYSCDPPTHVSSSKDKADQCPDDEHDDGEASSSSSSSKVSSSKSWPAQICNSFCFKVPHGCGAVSGLLTKTVPLYLTLKSWKSILTISNHIRANLGGTLKPVLWPRRLFSLFHALGYFTLRLLNCIIVYNTRSGNKNGINRYWCFLT